MNQESNKETKGLTKLKSNFEKTNTLSSKEINSLFGALEDTQTSLEKKSIEFNDLKEIHTILIEHNSTIENELKQRSDQSEDVSKKLQFILNESKDCVGLINSNFEYEVVNESFTKVFNTTSENIVGKTVEVLWGEKNDTKQFKKQVKKAFNGNSQFGTFELEINNKRHYFDSNFFPYEIDGKITNVVNTFKDVTKDKELEKKVIQSQRMNNLGKLASSIAHDLNNILGPFYLGIKALETKLNHSKESIRILEILKTNTDRATNLIKQILSFSQGIKGNFLKTDIKFILTEIQGLIEETFPKDIQFKLSSKPTLNTIYADSTQLHQLLLNLCLNAQDAMPKGGKLILSAENCNLKNHKINTQIINGNFLKLDIKDTGIGMSKSEIAKIFEPFYTTKSLGKGTGLGLSTVTNVIKNHNGHIEVSSTTGKGTRFTIYLPSASGITIEKAPKIKISPTKHNNGTILIVDDEKNLREMIKSVLIENNFTILEAENGKEALRIFKKNKDSISLVIIDLIMPIMSGADTIKELIKENPTLSVIAMTGVLLEEGDSSKVIEEHVSGLLYKPFSINALMSYIEELKTPSTS